MQQHSSLWEGTRLGLVVATTIWIWLAAVDAIVGQPFRTFSVLGGIAQFTLLHYVLNLTYGIAIVWALHRAAREPSLVMGVAFGFFILEFGFVMLSAILSQMGLGGLAWVRILGGNIVGATVTFLVLWTRHPLARELRDATGAEDD